MDNSDRYIEKAERDASPDRFPAPGDTEGKSEERQEEIERTVTASSGASSLTSSSDASVREREADDNISRLPTQRDDTVGLERHATALSRIQTQRSQHEGTVAASLKSRQSKKPLPAFGAGKPYPPPLPEREEYVVEFDGHDDPLHAQNW
jgi:MFS transporter, DHA1 family, multidrug resistance protein